MSERVYHLAHKIAPDGRVSPWCAKTPRAVRWWVMDYERANCDRCKSRYRASDRPNPEAPK